MSQLDRYLEPPDPWECPHHEEHADPDDCQTYEEERREDAQIDAAEARADADREADEGGW